MIDVSVPALNISLNATPEIEITVDPNRTVEQIKGINASSVVFEQRTHEISMVEERTLEIQSIIIPPIYIASIPDNNIEIAFENPENTVVISEDPNVVNVAVTMAGGSGGTDYITSDTAPADMTAVWLDTSWT